MSCLSLSCPFNAFNVNDHQAGKVLSKVEHHNENLLKHPEKMAYVGQSLMYSIIKKTKKPYYTSFFFKCHLIFSFLH